MLTKQDRLKCVRAAKRVKKDVFLPLDHVFNTKLSRLILWKQEIKANIIEQEELEKLIMYELCNEVNQ